jgi:hypothetical protein
MFAYSDPTGTGLLQQVGALQVYREAVDRLHQSFHSERDSAFTLREAFDELSPGTKAETGTVEWKAFPVTAGEPPATIDSDRFRLQDEYVEWRLEKRADGSLAAVTFITEFTESMRRSRKPAPRCSRKRSSGSIRGQMQPTASFSETTSIPMRRARVRGRLGLSATCDATLGTTANAEFSA